MKKNYPNLNTLRFIASSLVVIHHIELYKTFFGLKNYWHIPFFQIIGKLGVVLFFVLSGFLITSLLLQEKDLKGKISIKNFYIRRILRIWPVYYLIVFLGFFLYPYIPFFDIPNKDIFPNVLDHRFPNVFYYLTIFANLGLAIYKDVPYTSQTWSLATEEQFYLFAPFVIILFRKHLLKAMLFIIFTYFTVKYFLDISQLAKSIFKPRHLEIARNFWFTFNINCMALGSIFAIINHNKSKSIKFILNKYTFLFSVTTVTILLLSGVNFGFFHYDIYGLLFGIIISNLACNKHYKNLLENRITSYLGSISYGIYMYHFVALTIGLRIAYYFGKAILVYPITFLLTFLIAHFSYQYFEKYFLKLKSKF